MRISRTGGRTARSVTLCMCALMLAAALVPMRATSDEPAAVKPFALIDRALLRWRARPRPQQLSYVVDFTGRNKARLFRRKYRVDHNVPDHATRVTVLVSEGPAPPFVQPEKPRLLPTETFGFVPPEAAAAAPQPAAAATNLPVIAAVHATVRYPYNVNFVGIETVVDRAAYHLQMDPRQSSDAYPLREIWIDAATYDVLQVVAQQFERLGPIAIPYLINARYAQQGPYWLIAHVEAGATIHAGLFSYSSSGNADFQDFEFAP